MHQFCGTEHGQRAALRWSRIPTTSEVHCQHPHLKYLTDLGSGNADLDVVVIGEAPPDVLRRIDARRQRCQAEEAPDHRELEPHETQHPPARQQLGAFSAQA